MVIVNGFCSLPGGKSSISMAHVEIHLSTVKPFVKFNGVFFGLTTRSSGMKRPAWGSSFSKDQPFTILEPVTEMVKVVQ